MLAVENARLLLCVAGVTLAHSLYGGDTFVGAALTNGSTVGDDSLRLTVSVHSVPAKGKGPDAERCVLRVAVTNRSSDTIWLVRTPEGSGLTLTLKDDAGRQVSVTSAGNRKLTPLPSVLRTSKLRFSLRRFRSYPVSLRLALPPHEWRCLYEFEPRQVFDLRAAGRYTLTASQTIGLIDATGRITVARMADNPLTFSIDAEALHQAPDVMVTACWLLGGVVLLAALWRKLRRVKAPGSDLSGP